MGSLQKFQKQLVGLNMKTIVLLNQLIQVFHWSLTTKLSKNAQSPNLLLAPFKRVYKIIYFVLSFLVTCELLTDIRYLPSLSPNALCEQVGCCPVFCVYVIFHSAFKNYERFITLYLFIFFKTKIL